MRNDPYAEARSFILNAWAEIFGTDERSARRAVINDGNLDWVAAGIESSVGRSACDRAATAMHRTVTGHPFVDGNHRLAVILAISLLQSAEMYPIVDEEEIGAFARSVDSQNLREDEVRDWIARSFGRR